MFFRRQSHDGSQWVSLIQDGATVHAAQVAFTGEGRPRVNWLWQADAASMDEGLRALQVGKRFKGGNLIGLLNRTHYRMNASEAPDIPREDWRDAMRWQLKEQVDFPVEDAVLDVLAMPHSTQLRQNNAVMVFMVPRAEYSAVELAADNLGLSWTALDVPETALRNVCALLEDGERAQAMVAFGQDHGMLVITFKGELLMARHIEVAVSAVTGDQEVRGAALSRAALEILRTIDTFERMHSQVSLAGLSVALPPGCGPDVLEMLAELIYVPLTALELHPWFDLEPLGDAAAQLARHVTLSELCVLGAALRAMPDAPERTQLNLLDPHSVLGQSPTWGAVLGVRLLGGVVALGTVAGLGLSAATTAYGIRASEMEAEINVLRERAAANPPSPVVQELEALRQKEAQQRQVQDALQGSMAWSSQGYSDYLMALGRQTHPGVWITGLNVTGDGNDIVLSGRTNNPAALPTYLQKLGQEERFRGRRFAQLDMSELPTGSNLISGVVQFSLRSVATGDASRAVGGSSMQDALRVVEREAHQHAQAKEQKR